MCVEIVAERISAESIPASRSFPEMFLLPAAGTCGGVQWSKRGSGRLTAINSRPFLISKISLFQNKAMQNLSSENEFYLHENKSHFLNNGLALM